MKFDQVREIIDVNFDEAKAPTRITENSFFESFNRTLPHIDNLSKDSLYLGHIYPGIFSTQTVPLTSSDLDLMRGVWKREVEHTSMRSKGDEKEIAKALKHFEFKPETEVEVLSSAKDVQKKTAGKNK